MSLIAVCSSCGKKFKVGADKAGKKFKCPCGATISAPSGATAEADPWEVSAESAESTSRNPPLPRRTTSKPAAGKKGKSSGAPVGMIVGILVGVVALLGVVGVGAWLLFYRDTSIIPNAAQATVTSAGQTAPGERPIVTTVGTQEIPRAPIVAIDFRKFLPEDAHVVVAMQPLKAVESQLITKTLPEAALRSFLGRMKRDLPLPPEKMVTVAFAYSPLPAGFPAETIDRDPSASFTAIMQFTDIQSKGVFLRSLAQGGDPDELEDPEIRRARNKETNKNKAALPANCTAIQRLRWLNEVIDPQKPGEPRKLVFPESCDLIVYSPDDQTVVIGLRSRIISIANPSGPSPFKDLLKDADVSREIIVAGTKLDEFNPSVKMLILLPGAELVAMRLIAASAALSSARQGMLQLSVAPGVTLVDLRLQARDEATAQQFEQQLQNRMQHAKSLAWLPATETQAGADRLGAKFFAELEKNWKLSRTGSDLRLEVGRTPKIDELAIADLGAALKEAWTVTGLAEDKNTLLQLGLAFQKFFPSYENFPPRPVLDHSPRHKLPLEKRTSWVAELLPQLGQAELANKTSSEQAWDSLPYNRAAGAALIPALLNSQIPVEKIDGFAPTHLVGIGGLSASGPTEKIRSDKAGAFAYDRATALRDLRDGASNTMIVAQAYTKFGPWIANNNATIRPFTTKPYLHGPDGIGGPGKSGPTMVLMADGSVRSLADNTDPSIIESLATINREAASATGAQAEQEIEPKLSLDPGKGSSSSDVAINAGGTLAAAQLTVADGNTAPVTLRGVLAVWDLATSQKKFSVPLESDQYARLTFSPNGKWIALVETQSKIVVRVLDAETGSEIKSFSPAGLQMKRIAGYQGEINANGIQFSPDGKLLVIGTTLGVYAWETTEWKQVWLVGQDLGKAMFSISLFSPDGKSFATGTVLGGYLVLWNAGGKTPVSSKKFSMPNTPITAIAISNDGHYLAAQPYSVGLTIFDVKTRQIVREVSSANTSSTKRSLAFLPDNMTLVYPHSDGSITLEDAVSGKLYCRLIGKKQSPFQFSMTSDGTKLIGGGHDEDRAVTLWEIPKRK